MAFWATLEGELKTLVRVTPEKRPFDAFAWKPNGSQKKPTRVTEGNFL